MTEGPCRIVAPSLGRAWLGAAEEIVDHGRPGVYDGLPIRESLLLDVVVEDPADDDGIITAYGDAERLEWMRANFASTARVDELGGAASYATRLYDYEDRGRDQVAWVIERLSRDPGARSAVVTMLQPLSDTTYIPCVSLLHFMIVDSAILLVTTAHSIDFGTKGYGNLVELARLQRDVAGALQRAPGELVLRVASAHVYERDLDTVRSVLASASAGGAVPTSGPVASRR